MGRSCWNFSRYALALAVASGLLLGLGTTATAQPAAPTTGTIFGSVSNPDGLIIGGADITLDGPTKAHTQSDSHGNFSFEKVLPGIYQVTVSKGSYESLSRTEIAVLANSRVNVTVELQPATFTSLKEIGRVTSRAAGAGGSINTSTAAVIVVPTQTFSDQGLTQVTRVLNETPGIVTTIPNFGFDNNGAYQSLTQEPQIRGSLPYETESLIDGHPIAIGASGFFSPVYLNTHSLQSVELVKGPGSMPTDINYSVNGSVNYRTLEPTRKPQGGLILDYNSYGGVSTNYQATGSLGNGKLGYAFNYGINGQPGPFQGTSASAGTLEFNSTAKINGQPLCGFGTGRCGGSLGPPGPAGVTGYLSLAYPIYICCDHLYSNFTGRSELAKLRYNFSDTTSMTAAFLGAQAIQTQFLSYSFPQQTFDPYNPSYAAFGLWPTPASGLYTGSLPPGTSSQYGTLAYFPSTEQNQQGLAETELRTAIGKTTALFRYYAGASNDYTYQALNSGTTVTFSGQVWGLLPSMTPGVFQSYNGQTETFTQTLGGLSSQSVAHFSGYSGEFDMPAGDNLYTISIDRTLQNAYYFFSGSTLVPNGASQASTTFMVRGSWMLGPHVTAMLGNYFVNYSSHYTPDGGVTWADAGHSFYGPRAALTWQPSSGTSFRFSAGSSLAPPYLTLINTQGGPPVGNNQGAVIYYFQTANNGTINPETAFGFDFGVDRRIGPTTVLSSDVYQTNLHGQYLTTSTANGMYTATSGPNLGKTRPLFINQTSNLGQSRYEGIELSLRDSPNVGVGYTIQGALLRAYTYNLPAGFYDTGNGPNTTNLGVIANANFYPSGNGYNGVGGRVPYAQGYGELNYRAPNQAYVRLGATYYGNNNSYNAPPFFIVSATGRYPLGKNATLQVSGDNLTNSLNGLAGNLFGGLYTPLVNGTVGVTTQYNVGPETYHLTLELKTGK
jgi:outer membrane receptor protein involved in Fe transport